MFYYGASLPHWHPPGHVLFVTVRLQGSIPQEAIEKLHADAQAAGRAAHINADSSLAAAVWQAAERQCFRLLEHYLDQGQTGPDWLREPEIQRLVLDALLYQHRQGHYELLAACVMPNHLHATLRLLEISEKPFAQVWADFKRFTARMANQQLSRTGHFWQSESYDHVLRDGDVGISRAVQYTAHNPVKAGLCADWREWSGTWIAPEWQPE